MLSKWWFRVKAINSDRQHHLKNGVNYLEKNMKQLLLIYLVFCGIECDAQPKWISETPSGYVNDFYVASGLSRTSESDARQIAFGNALQKVIHGGMITISSTQDINNNYVEKFRDGESLSLDVVSKIQNEIKISGESQTIKGLKEEETYTQFGNGVYTVWILVKTPKRNPQPYTGPSKLSSVLRSLVPSVEQFYKGHSTKGYFVAGGTVSFAASGFVFSSLKITAESDAKNSRTQVLRDYYNGNANTYNNIAIACFIATAAVYVYNVVDALATDGDKVYVYVPKYENHALPITHFISPHTQNLISVKFKI
jgi:hypothetical protein